MGRKSKLTPKQWAEIERRLVAGESGRKLAREFEISETAVRDRCSETARKIREVSQELVAVEEKLHALPESAQITARADAAWKLRLRANLMSTLDAAQDTARIAHQAANKAIREVKDPLAAESLEKMRGVAALVDLGNKAMVPVASVAGGKEAIQQLVAAGDDDGDGEVDARRDALASRLEGAALVAASPVPPVEGS